MNERHIQNERVEGSEAEQALAHFGFIPDNGHLARGIEDGGIEMLLYPDGFEDSDGPVDPAWGPTRMEDPVWVYHYSDTSDGAEPVAKYPTISALLEHLRRPRDLRNAP